MAKKKRFQARAYTTSSRHKMHFSADDDINELSVIVCDKAEWHQASIRLSLPQVRRMRDALTEFLKVNDG